MSSANYFWELLVWLNYALLVHCLTGRYLRTGRPGYVFCGVSAVRLVALALKKHQAYQLAFDGYQGRPKYPKERKAILPFLL